MRGGRFVCVLHKLPLGSEFFQASTLQFRFFVANFLRIFFGFFAFGFGSKMEDSDTDSDRSFHGFGPKDIVLPRENIDHVSDAASGQSDLSISEVSNSSVHTADLYVLFHVLSRYL